MADLAQLQAWLVEAQSAYHSVMIGGGVTVVVDQNGERVEYSRANALGLAKYIATLQAQINSLLGVAVTGGPLRPLF
ncbi:MAG: gpW family head-tail joining protein [Lysobacter sp.]